MTAWEIVGAVSRFLQAPQAIGCMLLAVVLQPVLLGQAAQYMRRSTPLGVAAFSYRRRGLGPPLSLAQILLGLGAAFLVPGILGAGWLPLATALPLGLLLFLLAAFDLRAFTLPDRITLPLTLVGLVSASDTMLAASGLALWALLTSAIALLHVRIRQSAGLGQGDVKLCAAIGAWLGPADAAVAIAASSIAALAAALVVSRGDAASLRRLRLPLGLFLSLGLWLFWIAGMR